jgi:hypothetical protein
VTDGLHSSCLLILLLLLAAEERQLVEVAALKPCEAAARGTREVLGEVEEPEPHSWALRHLRCRSQLPL